MTTAFLNRQKGKIAKIFSKHAPKRGQILAAGRSSGCAFNPIFIGSLESRRGDSNSRPRHYEWVHNVRLPFGQYLISCYCRCLQLCGACSVGVRLVCGCRFFGHFFGHLCDGETEDPPGQSPHWVRRTYVDTTARFFLKSHSDDLYSE